MIGCPVTSRAISAFRSWRNDRSPAGKLGITIFYPQDWELSLALSVVRDNSRMSGSASRPDMGGGVSALPFLDTAPCRGVLNASDCLQLNGFSFWTEASVREAFLFSSGIAESVWKENHMMGVMVKKTSPGLGLFAARDYSRGETVIEYAGIRVPASEGPKGNNRYLFSLNSKWDIDGSPRWNTARYINHSCRPNCIAIRRGGHIYIVARRRIRSGDEFSYDYGREYFDTFIRPYGCRCRKCAKR